MRRLTTYSNIFDLRARKVYLYYQGQYNEVVAFDLEQELAKGERVILLSELFSNETLQSAQTGFARYHAIGQLLFVGVSIIILAVLGLLLYGVYRKLRLG
jgi:hypothetical protein